MQDAIIGRTATNGLAPLQLARSIDEPGGMPADDLLLREHRIRAERRLAAAAGDATLCVIGRSGESFPEVKYREGAAAALMEVERRARGGSVESALSETTISWRDGLDVARRRFGADWIAYRQGGLDELESLATAIEAGGE